MVTLKDIAAEAGVSVMTVSRVVNGQLSKVSDANIQKIQKIIENRGYVPSQSARSLSSRSSKIIAIVAQGDGDILEYPYNASMIGQIGSLIQKHGYSPMLYFASEYQGITKKLHAWNVDGAIFLGTFDENLEKIQSDNKIPLIFTDCYSPIRQITNVGLDDFKGGVMAARYLLKKGHTNLAFVGSSTDISGVVRQRLKGFASVCTEAGYRLSAEQVLPDAPTLPALKTLCSGSHPVTAFFASADRLAITLMRQLHELGFRVPQDCSIIGFDDLPTSSYITPSLTTIRQDIHLKAETAVDLLFRHIANAKAPAENIILDVQLIERESVSSLPPDR